MEWNDMIIILLISMWQVGSQNRKYFKCTTDNDTHNFFDIMELNEMIIILLISMCQVGSQERKYFMCMTDNDK